VKRISSIVNAISDFTKWNAILDGEIIISIKTPLKISITHWLFANRWELYSNEKVSEEYAKKSL
jgi:hypothetical protein